jgi:hypothetical protein
LGDLDDDRSLGVSARKLVLSGYATLIDAELYLAASSTAFTVEDEVTF